MVENSMFAGISQTVLVKSYFFDSEPSFSLVKKEKIVILEIVSSCGWNIK